MLWLLRLIYKRLDSLRQLLPFLYCYVVYWNSTVSFVQSRVGRKICLYILSSDMRFHFYLSSWFLSLWIMSSPPLSIALDRSSSPTTVAWMPTSQHCRCNSQVILILSDGAGCGTCVAPIHSIYWLFHHVHILPNSPLQTGAVCSSVLPKHQTMPVMQTSMAPPHRLLTYQGLSSPWYEFRTLTHLCCYRSWFLLFWSVQNFRFGSWVLNPIKIFSILWICWTTLFRDKEYWSNIFGNLHNSISECEYYLFFNCML